MKNSLKDMPIEIVPTSDLGKADIKSIGSMPLLSEIEFKALKKSIKRHGQLDPIIIWRGLIVDGRNRVNALKELGIETVLVQKLPHKATIKSRRDIVNQKETKREKSLTQKACYAYRYYLESEGESIDNVLVDKAVTRTAFYRAKYIHDRRRDWFDILLSGGDVVLNELTGRTTTSLYTIKETIVKAEEKEAARLKAKAALETGSLQEDYTSGLSDKEREEYTEEMREKARVFKLFESAIQNVRDALPNKTDKLIAEFYDMKYSEEYMNSIKGAK